jgi:uncharacterized membrane protein YfcA
LSDHSLIATLIFAPLVGGLIGSIGIGGVLLPPWFMQIAGLGVRDAVAISMASFIVTGSVALVWFGRASQAGKVSLLAQWWPLVIATAPGALLGALTLAVAPEQLAVAGLAAVLAATGLRLLLPREATAVRRLPPEGLRWLLGAAAGFVSALTGTGGPMVLVPVLLWLGVPILPAIALGQIVQLPIAVTATAGNFAMGAGDLRIAALVGAMMIPGVLAGRRIAEAMLPLTVTRVVAVALISTAVWLAIKVV